jgi:hypothetical protein
MTHDDLRSVARLLQKSDDAHDGADLSHIGLPPVLRGGVFPVGHPNMRYFKVGGLRFLRIGRFQISWCMCKRKRKPTPADLAFIDSLLADA